MVLEGITSGSVVANLPVNAGDVGSIPGSGWFTGEGNGNPFQFYCLGNPMDRGAWRVIVLGVTNSVEHDLMTKQQRWDLKIKWSY